MAALPDGIDERYLVPALIRGLDILTALSGDQRSLTLSEVAATLSVTRSSAYRLLYTLSALGYVAYDNSTKSYRLGPQVLSLGFGYLAARDLVEVAMPHLIRLRDRTGWSAHLGELHGRDVVYLARVATRRSIASTVHVGTRLHAAPPWGACCCRDFRRRRSVIFMTMPPSPPTHRRPISPIS
jgi:IclR family pca regulon transcriptional regulator